MNITPNSVDEVAASLNLACHGLSPTRFIADPDIDPIDKYEPADFDNEHRYPASALCEFRGDWKFIKDSYKHVACTHVLHVHMSTGGLQPILRMELLVVVPSLHGP